MEKLNMGAVYVWVAAGVMSLVCVYLEFIVIASILAFVSFVALFFTPR